MRAFNFDGTGKCSLCGGRYIRWGNNPEPLKRLEERCCDECNEKVVIPARMKLLAPLIR